MFEKLRQSKLMFWSVELLVLVTLVLVSSKVKFLFQPLATLFSTLFAPILIGGFLYYMLNPLVNFLGKKLKVKRLWAIVLVFALVILLLVLFIGTIIPELARQIAGLAKSLPRLIHSVESWTDQLLKDPQIQSIDIESYLKKVDISFASLAKGAVSSLSNGLGSIIASIANLTMIVVTAPFILFYMLKDGDRLIPAIEKYLPKNHKNEIIELLHKMNETISKYISGQALECLFVAVATSIGYTLVGVQYGILFGCIAGLTNMIPYLGPYLGLAPAVLVTVFDSPIKAILACVVVIIVQQIDGNIIYPMVIGKSLNIHPLTIILILLVAGNIAGLLGMILGVPFYAVCKTVFVYIFDIVRLNQNKELYNTVIKNDK